MVWSTKKEGGLLMGTYDNQVIITGGLGFIGSHLVKRLIKEKYDILLVDNQTSGSFSNVKDFFQGEILDVDKLKAYPKIPLIFHLGMPSCDAMFESNPSLYSYTVKDFLTILSYCRKWGSKLVYTSSASLYWSNPVPFNENMEIHPKDLYSECSYQMERLTELYSTYGIKSVGLRIFNAYGPKEEHKNANASMITQLAKLISTNTSPTLYDNGEQTRDWIHVDDVVDALMLTKYVKTNSEIFNIGSGVSTSFNDIVSMINLALDRDVKPKYKKNPVVNYVSHSLADISKAKKQLGFNPKVSLEEGIKRVTEEYLYKGLFVEG
jgi:nucleoside-diphosphate-sugar epimerase